MAAFTSLRLPAAPLCLAEHPSSPVLAVGLTSGGIVVANLNSLNINSSTTLDVTHKLSASCVATSFLSDPVATTTFATSLQAIASPPRFLAAAGSTVSLFHAEHSTNSPVRAYALPPHDDVPRCASSFLSLDAHCAVIGDDAGGLHLLDTRAPRLRAAVLQQGDYISAMASERRFSNVRNCILAASGDGTLCAYDLRGAGGGANSKASMKLVHVSDAFNDDLLSLAVCDDAPRAVAGCLSGALNVYNLNVLEQCGEGKEDVEIDERIAHVDRFHGHPECVNAVLPTPTAGVVATASTDGLVRVVDVNNRSLLGVLDYDRSAPGASTDDEDCNDNDDGKGGSSSTPSKKRPKRKRKKSDEEWPIETMVRVNGLQKLTYALLSHDDVIRFCDASLLCDDDEDDDDNEENMKRIDDSEVGIIGKEGTETEKVEQKSENVKNLRDLQEPEPLLTKSQRKKKKNKRNQRDAAERSVKEKRTSGFFDDL